MKLETLFDVYVDELKDLYSAEVQLLRGLTRMARAASSPELGDAFGDHLVETIGQIDRLEEIFDELRISPEGKVCKAMQGLLEEVFDAIQECDDPTVRDAALIATAQRIEHYEIAGYGCVRTFARLLHHEMAAMLLQESLEEEGDADHKLTQLAETIINTRALAAVA